MKQAYFKHILALLLFGSNGIIASYILLSSHEIVFLRTLLGSLLLIAIFAITRQPVTFHKHRKSLLFLVCSGISMGASWMFLYEAYQQIGVSISSLIYYCGPMIVMALSPVLFKEKLTLPKLMGFFTVLAGLLLINGEIIQDRTNGWGIFCGLMSAMTYATMVMFNKKSAPISGLENSMLQLITSFLTVAVFVGIRQQFVIPLKETDLIPILVLGLVNTGVGCYWYFSSLTKLPVQTVSVCGYLEPLSAVIFSAVFLHETMSWLQLVGAVLIIGGAVYAEFGMFSRKTTASNR